MDDIKKSEHCSHVGIFCELRKGKSQNQRWSVYFMGDYLDAFRTRNQAKQYAEHRIWAAIKDMVALEGFQS